MLLQQWRFVTSLEVLPASGAQRNYTKFEIRNIRNMAWVLSIRKRTSIDTGYSIIPHLRSAITAAGRGQCVHKALWHSKSALTHHTTINTLQLSCGSMRTMMWHAVLALAMLAGGVQGQGELLVVR